MNIIINIFRKFRSGIISSVQETLETIFRKFGFFIVKDDYYCPIPDKKNLANEVDKWWKASELVGIDIDVSKMESFLKEISSHTESFQQLPDYSDIVKKGYGPGYGLLDALLLVSIVRYLKPKRIIEVGSGISTFYGTHALQINSAGKYICIEPYPYPALYSLPKIDKIIDKKVETLDIDFFQQLEKDDILFIDSSHTVKIGGDIVYLYLEVLPRLKSGVVIHIHDIAFPYPIWSPDQVIKGNRKWTEYAILQAFLSFNNTYEIMICMSYLHFIHPEILSKYLYLYNKEIRPPVSLWIRKI